MFDGLKYDADPARRAVHVWDTALDLDDARVAALAGLLDEEETSRVRRFHFERDRRRFTVARGVLRTLLGRYLDAPAARLTFGHEGRGKPTLTTPGGNERVCFNVSHSDGRALFAFARGVEVGIDLEAGARLGEDWPLIARRVFSAREQAELATVAPPLRRAAFLDGWTRKEAYLKATAQGIVDGLTSIEVTLNPARPAAFLTLPDADRTRGWTLRDLRVDERFAAALVVEGGAGNVERREFSPP